MAPAQKGRKPAQTHSPTGKKAVNPASIKRRRKIPGNPTPDEAARDLGLKEADADRIVGGGGGWINGGGWVNRGGWTNGWR